MTSFSDTIRICMEDEEYFGSDGACPAVLEPGHERLLIVSGENAGGKSFFTKVLQARAREVMEKPKIEIIPISMAMRTMPGMHRVFMFGDEAKSSTGQASFRAVRGGLNTCRGRSNPHILIMDEPDVGLSEGYQAALGEMINEFASDLPEQTLGLVVVSHARPLVSKLMHLNPTCIRVGDDLRPTRQWLEEGDLPRTVEDIEALQDKALARYRAIHAVVEARKSAPKPGL